VYRNLRNGVAMLLLAAAALVTWYFGRPAPKASSRPADDRAFPLGYYLRDAVLLGTDDQGAISYRLHAGLVEERPDAAALALEDVRFEYQPSEKIPWSIVAAKGSAPIGAERAQLDLSGGVELTRAPAADGRPTRIETDTLRLEPDKHVASAAGPVRISVGGNALDAVGLTAFLEEDRIELESQVHGRFVQ
jgi:lipopolysaccharide export system protein LptC